MLLTSVVTRETKRLNNFKIISKYVTTALDLVSFVHVSIHL